LTEGVREREDLHLDSVLTTSKVLVGAVLHEIRNLSAAASVAHANLSRQLAGSEDFRALGTLVASLEEIASSELNLLVDRASASVDLAAVLREFRVVAEPSAREAGVRLALDVEEGLRVRVDQHSLLQILLNLFRNSIRALRGRPLPRISVTAEVQEDDVLVRFLDSGSGVKTPENLFQPFRTTAEATGLGLYVSRAILRSFGGELYYEPSETGALFIARLRISSSAWEVPRIESANDRDQGGDHRRSQLVSPGAEASPGV
jgi:C4-dicarboxylate-specific signal transduction histidine kinase